MKSIDSEEMKRWPRNPVIYELNTWVWLNDLSRKHERRSGSRHGPGSGVGCHRQGGLRRHLVHGCLGTESTGIGISMRNEGLLQDFRRALPDFAPEHNVGSPNCVHRYVVDAHFGGPKGLARARSLMVGSR